MRFNNSVFPRFFLQRLTGRFLVVLFFAIFFYAGAIGAEKKKSPITSGKSTAAIFFLVDNSASMGSQATIGNDQLGSRFRVTHDLIDTIKARFDTVVEVGVAVFARYLCYNPLDHSLFKKCPGYDTGSYIPLLGLNNSYPPSGDIGYNILRTYLATTVDTSMNAYVTLKYKPTQPFPVGNQNSATCINVAFDAAKDAFANTTISKNRQFIIFFSDGEANIPQDTTVNKFVAGTNVPTTFTVFFTSTGQAPPNLITMTNNIKANGYSAKNPSSSIWAIQTDYPTLMQLLIDSVLIHMNDTLTTQSVFQKKNNSFPEVIPEMTKGNATVRYTLSERAWVSIKIYDIHGRLVLSAINRVQEPGQHLYPLSAERISNGNYIIDFSAGVSKMQRRIAVVY